MIGTAFLGTPESAVPTLQRLAAISSLDLVITMPDRPVRRSGRPQPSPVRVAAEELGLAVSTPTSVEELTGAIAGKELDVAVVAAFGMIIPADVLAIPRRGMVNVHFSLLPRWRGAAPVERAMLAGDTTTGVTLMQMDAGLDTGPELARWETSIEASETAGELTDRLAVAGAELVASSLEGIVRGEIEPVPQDEEHATSAPRLTTDEARIDWSKPAALIANAVHAYNPRPGAFSFRGDERTKIHRARPVAGAGSVGAMTVEGDAVLVGCGEGLLSLLEVQSPGGRAMDAAVWARGLRDPEVPFR